MSSSAVEKEKIQNMCISDSDQSFAKDEEMMNNWHLQSLPRRMELLFLSWFSFLI
jgi:hypothetical protein